MAENKFPATAGCASGGGSGREMVCIETNRILDSCKDRDCFENVRVFLTDFGNEILERTNTIRVKRACVSGATIHIDPVQFNRGFYSINIRMYVHLELEGCIGGGRSQEFDGVAVLEKCVILYGSESNVSIFKSSADASDFCAEPKSCGCSKNVPIAVLEVVEPVVLGCRVTEEERECRCCCCCCDIPEPVCSHVNGQLTDDGCKRYLTVSLGIFSVVRIVRPAQYLVSATEYCVPDKECVAPQEDDPCSLFRSMAFPTAEFCPPSFIPHQRGNGCGSERNRCGC